MSVSGFSKDKFYKVEPYLFLMLLAAGTIPLLSVRYFVTLDGPAHLYNANLIKQLWFQNSTTINDLFRLNAFPVPNWSGHFMMALLNIIFPDFISEKGVFLVYFLLTPLFFRKFLLLFYPNNRLITYLMLLFVHNHNLYFGFLNMSLGITFLFITAYYFVKHCREASAKKVILLSLLFLAIYFSHILIFLITIMLLVAAVILLAETETTASGIKVMNTKELKKRLVIVAIAAIPAFVLSLIYFLSIESVEKGARLELSELLKYVIDIRPLLTFCFCDSWITMNHLLLALFIVMIMGNIYLLIRDACTLENGRLHIKMPLRFSFIWFTITAGFLVLFLIMPNSILMTERLIVLFYLFFIIWLASLKYPGFIKVLCLLVVMLVHSFYIYRHFEVMHDLTKDAEGIVAASGKMEPESMVLTLNYSDNWLHSHITGYLGSNGNIAVLENYEAALKWFPVQWKTQDYEIEKLIAWGVDNKKIAGDLYVNREDSTCFSLKSTAGQIIRIPYVFVLGNMEDKSDDEDLRIKNIIRKSYSEIHTDHTGRLFELKSRE